MTAEILGLVLARIGPLRNRRSKALAVAVPTPEAFQIRIKNTCRINCLQKTVKYTVRSSALDWQLSGVTGGKMCCKISALPRPDILASGLIDDVPAGVNDDGSESNL